MRFFSTGLPRLRQKWQVKEGERFRHVTRDFVRLEPQFAIRDKSDGWLDFHVHYTAGREAVFSSADVNRLLQTGRGHVRLKDGKVAVVDSALASDLEEVLRDCDPRQEAGGYRIPHLQRGYLEASIASWKGSEAFEIRRSLTISEAGLGTLKEKLRPYQVQGAAWLLERARRRRGSLAGRRNGTRKDGANARAH